MFEYWSALPADTSRNASVIFYTSSSPRAVARGSPDDGYDLTQFSESITQSESEVTIRLRWHMELYTAASQPRPGQVLKLLLNGRTLWIGIVQSISNYRESRGERSMTVTARSRDAGQRWRGTKIATPAYSLSTDLVELVRDVLGLAGLSMDEALLPSGLGAHTVHTSTQLADITAWEALTKILQAVGREPYIDAIGRFKAVHRSFDRPSTHHITADRVLSVESGGERSSVTKVMVKWLDPNLTKTYNDERMLGTANITAGFFQLTQRQEIFFSEDKTQRAEGTRLVIKQSANSGLLHVADEEYFQMTETHGEIVVTTHAWVPTLAVVSLVAMVATGYIGDAVVGGSMTVPVGRPIHTVAEGVILLIMMSIGTGVYEIWGTPFDYVHGTNRTVAYDTDAPEWVEQMEEIENDFIMNEPMAQAVASRELAYGILSSVPHNVVIVDDPSIERGDILQFPNGARMYVTGYSRNLSRGSVHELSVSGFRI